MLRLSAATAPRCFSRVQARTVYSIEHNDALLYPHASSRNATFARNGMVAASQPLAADAGLQILKQGGNAVDAAIATAAALTVVEPTGNGIGGDAFALVWMRGKLHGLNASSHAPAALTLETVHNQGYSKRIPQYGWLPVTVPGTPAAWAALSERWGNLPFSDVLRPAVVLAEQGFPVSPTISLLWQRAVGEFGNSLEGADIRRSWFDTFTQSGRAPDPGKIFHMPFHAESLADIANTNAESFYRGELADKIDRFARETGGLITKEDLASYQVEWVQPISLNYRGYDIWEIPPNGQGLVALMALNILKGFEFSERDTTHTFHTQVEAMKLAYVDGMAFVTQPDHMPFSVEDLLSDGYADRRRCLIGEEALTPTVGAPNGGGTVYLATADGDGNMVSFIQSNFHGFGSGVVVPGTGIALHNRGCDFSLDPEHPNCLKPGKKTFHTIIPGFITRGEEAIGPFGVMGAYMQPQGQVQVITNMIDFGMNPQAALDAPRWQWFKDTSIGLEADVCPEIAKALKAKGHSTSIASDWTSYGRGQIIVRNPTTGVLCGGTEKRTDGHIACY